MNSVWPNDFDERMALVPRYITGLAPLRPFANGGKPLSERGVQAVATVSQAVRLLEHDWEDGWLDARNEVSSRLVLGWHDASFQHWNEIAERCEVTLEQVGITAEIRAAAQTTFPDTIELVCQRTQTMVACAVIEWCYEPLVHCVRVREFARWIFEGRLPCAMVETDGRWVAFVY